MMGPTMLVLSVALASYAVVSTLMSAAAAAVWRAGLIDRDHPAPATRAWRLTSLRALPSVGAALVTVIVVVPGYLAFEPRQESEAVGPVLLALAVMGAWLLATGVLIASRAVLATWRLERAWLSTAAPIAFNPPAGVPAFVVETLAPVVALVGVFSPKLVAAQSVIDACSEQELARIVAHERGHLRSRDNLRRWLIAAAPDVLRWTADHDDIAAAWSGAAEDAADDAATSGERMARAELAALLVKIAGLAPTASWTAATVSPFVEADGLDRRVRRLLEDDAAPARSNWPAFGRLVGVGATILLVAGPFNAAVRQATHEVVETIVDLGR
ncbi:MAG: M56 family metallopeptidase [Vicinamibacterales bacterium]